MSNVLKCKSCGEEVQKGVVRCWNCQSFMRDDIEQAYLEKQASPQGVLLSDPNTEEEGSSTLTLEEAENSSPLTSAAKSEGVIVDHTLGHQTPATPIEIVPVVTEKPSVAKNPAPSQQKKAQQPTNKVNSSEPSHAVAASTETEHHSVKTAGDELLAAALAEEKESGNKQFKGALIKPTPKTKGGIIVFCPNGHPIEVQERHRGKVGKCPKCREAFNVPAGRSLPVTDSSDAEGEPTGETEVTKPEFLWMTDVRLHEIDLQKLSIKPGSLEKQFKLVDIRLNQEELLFLTLSKGAGLFGAAEKKRSSVREEVMEKLSTGISVNDCGAEENFQIESPEKLTIVQPVPEGQDSLFAGIPIFGEGRIAVSVPRTQNSTQRTYLSFSLSEFRTFSTALDECCDIVEFGIECGIPLEDLTMEKKCHYTDETFDALENIEYYLNDPAFKVEISGRECEECGLEISEEGRKKENLGGKSGKGITKAKCPKCTKKFGNITHYCLK
ncbi:hypothetical protein MNBD_PLANCTO02-920 [hydrothermal vent metagenome]|uniref:Uncharacterized protein n=1 Tax=hydrothermal vent metagenome TaxID=652676 RepID=A0A3B1DJF8_9ZZZZ